MRRRRRKGSPAMLGEDEVEEDVAERVSARGSTARRSRRWRRGWTRWCNTGTTVDAVSRWREHGSVGHGGGRAMERDQGKVRCLRGRGMQGSSSHIDRSTRGAARRRQLRGAHAVLAVEHLPAWLSQAARWRGGWARPAGGPGRWRQVSFSVSLFSFLFFLYL